MLTHLNFNGKVAVITGGATGIGAATTELFAQLGAKTVIASRNKDRLIAKASDIRKMFQTDCQAFTCDVRDESSVNELYKNVIQHYGRVDILINNAGGTHLTALEDIDANKWHKSFAINVDAAFYCTQIFGQYFREQGKGSIVNVSSVAGIHGTKQGAHYSSAKAALQMLTKVTAAEWGPYGIRVNCVAPGMILSDIAEQHLKDSGINIEDGIKTFPLQRAGKPDDVANIIVFLASDAASYITGETISVNGGPRLGGSA